MSVRLFYLLGSRSVFHWSLLAVAFVEAIHASRGVNQLLLAGEKRMASRADLNVEVALLGRPGVESFAAGAGDCDLAIIRMNLWFHYSCWPSL